MTAAITLNSVSKSFIAMPTAALHGINLDVLRGTCTAILGPSGSGKSTILRIIAGLEDPSGGRVLINGVDVTTTLPERRGIGMVFQRPLLFPHLSVLDNIAFAARAAGMTKTLARQDALRYLDMVQLADFGHRPIRSLSGGQEQRVALARALAAKPTILLLDEPFSALDPTLQDEMHGLLAEIRHELSPTVLLVTHDRDEAVAVADRIALIDDGMLLQHDVVDRIYNRPASLAVAKIMGGKNRVDGIVSDGIHQSPVGLVAVGDDVPNGPGILVIRQEAIAVEPALSTLGSDSSFSLTGVVSSVHRAGPRRSVVIDANGVNIFADLAAGAQIAVGDKVGFTMPPEAVFVVPR